MLLNMRTFLALLWGISLLFALESMSATIPETSSINTTPEPHKTTKQMINAPHTESDEPVAAPAVTTVPPTLTTASVPPMQPASTTQPGVTSKVLSTISSAKSAQAPVFTQTLSGPAAPTPTVITANPTSEAAPVFDPTKSETSTMITGVSSPPQPVSVRRTSISTSQFPATAGSTAEPSTTGVSTDSLISTTSVSTTDSTTNVPKPTDSTTKVSNPTDSTTKVSSLTDSTTNVPIPTDSTTNVSNPTDSTTNVPNHTDSTTNVSNPTDSTTNLSSPTDSTTNVSNLSDSSLGSTTAISITTVSTTNGSIIHVSSNNDSSTTIVPTTSFSTTNGSTTPSGILIPLGPKRLPIPTTKSTPAATTTAPKEVSKSPTSTEVQPCSTRGLVKQCLIAVAALAAVATIFMVSTIVLCTKLSTRKYKVRKPQPATEMMCISALLPERNYTYTRQRNPVSNGVLVMHHSGADSDEDGGDNLTLSSFLPDNDRFV